jgi:nicotinamidase-related amidase
MSLATQSRSFLNFVEEWMRALPPARISKVVPDPARAAVVCVDIINGFCTVGPLASPRVQGIVKPIVKLFSDCRAAGVRHFVLTQDTHAPDAVEFAHYPPHCIRGHVESQTAPELLKLPFADEFVVVEKNSIASHHNTGFDAWLADHPRVDTFIVAGDCTDLCTYQLAMHLRLRANAHQHRSTRVILPENCAQTYDTPVKLAKQLGIPAHDGDLLHAVFLYNMWCNGVEVVKRITR